MENQESKEATSKPSNGFISTKFPKDPPQAWGENPEDRAPRETPSSGTENRPDSKIKRCGVKSDKRTFHSDI